MPQLSKARVTSIGSLIVDAYLSESHDYKGSITKHRVERGSLVGDHIATDPVTLSIEGVVSDTPIGAVAQGRALGDATFAALGVSNDGSYSEQAADYLEKIFEGRELVTIETSRGTFKNMGCSSLSFPVDAQTGFALRFSATFEEIVLVENVRIRRPVSQPRAAKKDIRGVKSAKQLAKQLTAAMDAVGGEARWVTWRKGVPPGSNNIYATERVFWGHMEAFDIGQQGGYWQREVFEGHGRHGERLSQTEVWALEKDLVRDRQAAGQFVVPHNPTVTGPIPQSTSLSKVVPQTGPRTLPTPKHWLFGG